MILQIRVAEKNALLVSYCILGRTYVLVLAVV
jgi:hypothetical protein